MSGATFQSCRDRRPGLFSFRLFFTRYTALSQSPSPADFTVCGPDSSQGPRMAGMHGHPPLLWHLCVHPFLYVGSAPRQVYGLLGGVTGWISAPAPLPLNRELALLHMVARGRAWYSFRVMGSSACVGVSLSCVTCYPNGSCCKC